MKDSITRIKEIVNQIPQDYFTYKYATFLDPFEKDSPFLDAIAERLMDTLKADFPNAVDREKYIWENILYSYDGKNSTTFLSDNMSDEEQKLWSKRYSVIIGVPPFYYQNGTSRICVYLPFIEKISRISKGQSLMIFLTPTNWYMSQNGNCAEYRNRVIIPLMEALYDFYQTKDVFPKENFMGGVAAIRLREREIKNSYNYRYTDFPAYPFSIYQADSREWSIGGLMRRGVYYHINYLVGQYMPCRHAIYGKTMSIRKGGFALWSIKSTKDSSKGYVIQRHTPGQPVPASNFVVEFDSKVFDPQAVEKFFQTKLARYLVYNESPTTSWSITKSAFDYIPVDLLYSQTYLAKEGIYIDLPAINWADEMVDINQVVYAYFNLPQSLIDYIEDTIK